MRGILLVLSSFLLSSVSAQVNVNRYTAPLAGTAVLKDIEDKYSAQVVNLEMPSPDGNIDKIRLKEVKQQISKLYPHQRQQESINKTTAISGPSVVIGFVADSLTGVPPDNYMAISKAGIAVSVVNSNIAVLNGATGQMTSRKKLRAFSNVSPINTISDNRFDPKVIYDPDADRFICVILNNRPGNADESWTIVGFSQSNDPADTWKFYVFPGTEKNDSTWFDYPAIAITKDEFFLTGNKIRFNTSWQAGFKETVIYQIRKQDGYNGAANVTYQVWDNIMHNGAPIRNLHPVKGGSAISGPEQYFLSNRNFDIQNDTIFLVKIPDVIGSGNNNLSVKVLKADQPYGVPPNGRQIDTFTLATNDGRVLGAYREGNEIQFVSTSIYTPTGASAVYYGKITDYDGTPAIQTQFFTVDTLDFGYPNISFAGNPWGLNQSIISFNYTGPSTYAGVGAITYDGTQFSGLVKVKEGEGVIQVLNSKEQRWGDYSGSQVDWNNYGSVWIEGIFGKPNNAYGNWMAKLNSPLLGVQDKTKQKVVSKLYPNPAEHYVSVDFDLSQRVVCHFTIHSLDGKIVDKVLSTNCKAGRNRIQFNVAHLSTGSYLLKGMDDKGNVVLTQRFIRQ